MSLYTKKYRLIRSREADQELKGEEHFQWNAQSILAPSGAGLLKVKVFWRESF
jgi:hypothetical protein